MERCIYLYAILTHIFIHVKCFDIFEGDFFHSIIFNQIPIHSKWCASRRQTQYKVSTIIKRFVSNLFFLFCMKIEKYSKSSLTCRALVENHLFFSLHTSLPILQHLLVYPKSQAAFFLFKDFHLISKFVQRYARNLQVPVAVYFLIKSIF